jgi:hypothetical protein
VKLPFEQTAHVFAAECGWKRWACMSQNRETVWHRSRAAAVRDAFERVGGQEQPLKVKSDVHGMTVERGSK